MWGVNGDGLDLNLGYLPSFSFDEPGGIASNPGWGSGNGAFDISNMDPSISDLFADPFNPDPGNMYFDGFDSNGDRRLQLQRHDWNPG